MVAGIYAAPDDRRHAIVQDRSTAWALTGADRADLARAFYADAMAALAGTAAQQLAGYRDLDSDEDTGDAMHYAYHCLHRAPDFAVEAAIAVIVERAEADTIALLEANWQAVERVVAALAKRDQLTAVELESIIADDLPC